MESVKRRRQYVYNPWLLSALYARLLFLEQLLALHQSLHPSEEALSMAQKSQLLGEARAEWAVRQVTQLHQILQKELYPLDLADCNIEYALYRLAALFRPTNLRFHAHCADTGDLYACERRLSLAVSEQQHPLVFDAVLYYLERHYVQAGQRDHQGTLMSLLLNAKWTMEQQCVGQQEDVVVCYDRALVLTMLYRVLFDELHSECKRRQTALLYQEGDTRPQLLLLDTQLRLLDQMRQLTAQQYHDEFRGYAVQAHPSDRVCEHNQHCNRQYTLRANPLDTLQQMQHEEAGESWHFVEMETGAYRYLDLQRHRHHYVQMARRFVFDCALRRHHGKDCVAAPQLITEMSTTTSSTTTTSGLDYARNCNVCRYMDGHESTLTHFYTQCEQYHRVQLMLCDEARAEHTLNRALTPLLLPPLGSLNSWLYRTLHELQCLFADSRLVIRYSEYCRVRHCTSEREKHDVQLYEMVDLLALIQTVQDAMGKRHPDAEADCVLCGCAVRRGKLAPPNDVQCELALRIVLLEQLQRAMDEQRLSIEAYERSLSNAQLSVSVGSSEELHRNVRTVMVDIYMSYRMVLKEWLAQ